MNRDSDQQNESQVDSDSSQKKTKKIEKGRGESANDYIKHFKFYYEKFRKEHPKWNSAQISSIIKLLWRKRNLSLRLAKRTKQTRIKKDRPIKLLSGWLFFKNRLLKEKGCTLLEAKFLWKRLPREVKLMQTNLAKEMAGQPSRVKAFKQKICLAL